MARDRWERGRTLFPVSGLCLAVGALALSGCDGAVSQGQGQEVAAHGTTTAPGATAVGTEACTACHAEISASYAGTNKHGAISVFDPATAPESFDGDIRIYNPATDLWYQPLMRGDTLLQREWREDEAGEVVYERTEAAAYVIGSGNQTRSYLMRENGYVTEMPLTWYVERNGWDMSPGYEEANDRFDRKIILDCMTCHNAVPGFTRFTQNDFSEVPLGISCERCHGPGSDHVSARSAGWSPPPGAPDTTIVNPARLDRDRQLANCQQCHLAGVFVYAPGEDVTTFLSGQTLAENRTVFVPEDQLTDPDWVGIDSHPVRLARSACYAATEMTCSTCHDSHRSAEDLPDGWYNSRCATCHTDASDSGDHVQFCSRPEAADDAARQQGDCVGCHMQQGGTSDVPHVRFTDHWIRKDPGPPRNPDLGKPAFETPDPIRLVGLQRPGKPDHQVLVPREPENGREMLERAAAYFHFYETMHRVPAYLDTVLVQARQGKALGADHFEGQVALGRALAARDSLESAEVALRAAVELNPEDPWGHFFLGAVLEQRGNLSGAISALERAVDLQPRMMEAQVQLAGALFEAGVPEEAARRLEAALALDPMHQPRAWHNLGVLSLQLGRVDRAAEAFEKASALDPDLVDAHVQLASLLAANGDVGGAELAARRALAADPESIPALGTYALLQLQTGNEAEAAALLRRILDIDPGNTQARGLLDRLGGGAP